MSEIKDFVSLSSRFMAAIRAIETERSDRLFEDPFAAQLAGSETITLIAPKAKAYEDKGTPIVVVRTRFFDDFLMSSVSDIPQVVILGAGMDTRAFRLPLPSGIHVYEIDQPEVIETKESILKNTLAKTNRHTIKANLRQPWSNLLREQGYRADIPSVWLVEGLLYYLSDLEVNNLLKTISDLSATGSCLGADLVNVKALQSQQKSGELGKYWRSGYDQPENLFAAYGWKASVVQPGDEEANFGRYKRQPPRNIPDIARSFFVTAKKESIATGEKRM